MGCDIYSIDIKTMGVYFMIYLGNPPLLQM